MIHRKNKNNRQPSGERELPITEPNLLYIKYNRRLSTSELNQEKSKYGLISIKHATKRTDLIPSAANVVVVEGGDINQFKQDTNIVLVEEVPVDILDQVTNDPLYYNGAHGSQYGERVHEGHEAALEEFGFGEYYPTIGQIESKWVIDHPDISPDKVILANEPYPGGPSFFATHALGVGSIMIVDTNNEMGMTAMCPNCSLYFVNTYGIGLSLPESLEMQVEYGTKVCNYSVGGGGYSEVHQNAITDAYNNGLLFVVSAGNENMDLNGTFRQYCSYDNVLCVGSTQYNYDSSCTGEVPGPCDSIDVTANMSIGATGGSNIGAASCMDLYGNNTDAWGDECWFRTQTGTSFAAPVVTGLIGLLLSHKSDLTPPQMYEIVTSTNILPGVGQRPGKINFHEALSYMYENYIYEDVPLPPVVEEPHIECPPGQIWNEEEGICIDILIELEHPMGDINLDYEVDALDLLLLFEELIIIGEGGSTFSDLQQQLADLNSSGDVTINDLVILGELVLEYTQCPLGSECCSHEDCGTIGKYQHYCHSGWTESIYGPRFCIDASSEAGLYFTEYCDNNPCGTGDGDCDSDDQCAGELLCGEGSDNDNNCDFHGVNGIERPGADCCYDTEGGMRIGGGVNQLYSQRQQLLTILERLKRAPQGTRVKVDGTQTPTQPKTFISGRQSSTTSQCNDPNALNYNSSAKGCDPSSPYDYFCCEYYIGYVR